MLDIHTYSRNQDKILLTNKTPFYLDGQLEGIICHCNEISLSSIQKLVSNIMKSDQLYYNKKNIKERSYVIGQTLKDCSLTKRELDCVFYLIRGNSSKQIAKNLFLSPRTVESYIQNIKDKWQCDSKQQVIDYAVFSGFLAYIPDSALPKSLSVVIMESDVETS